VVDSYEGGWKEGRKQGREAGREGGREEGWLGRQRDKITQSLRIQPDKIDNLGLNPSSVFLLCLSCFIPPVKWGQY
jgi:predicted transposase YdaD